MKATQSTYDSKGSVIPANCAVCWMPFHDGEVVECVSGPPPTFTRWVHSEPCATLAAELPPQPQQTQQDTGQRNNNASLTQQHPNSSEEGIRNQESGISSTLSSSDEISQPSLSLLIVDFGDACIVRVEKNANGVAPLAQEVCSRNEGSLSWVDAPFAGVRAELDHRPVPRIERVAEDKRESDLHRYNFVQTNDKIRRLSSAAYDDLAAIFGKPAQVYEDAGTWTRLPSTAGYIGDPLEGLGIAIWRYTR